MKAMILAAGRGQRMGKLTEQLPKPMLKVGDQCLIEHQISLLKQVGVNELVINVSYHADKLTDFLQEGRQYQVDIAYSKEKERLETGGGILNALPLLGDQPFLLANADVFTEFDYQALIECEELLLKEQLYAVLVMVPNPEFKEVGDFKLSSALANDLTLLEDDQGASSEHLTYSGMALIHPKLFEGKEAGVFPLRDLYKAYMAKDKVAGYVYKGLWMDVGTPERLEAANTCYGQKNNYTKESQ